MSIQFACKCGKSYQAQSEQAGKKTKCVTCGNLLIVPRPGSAPLPAMVMVDTIKGERCADCGEMFMPHRLVEEDGDTLCRPCHGKRHASPSGMVRVQQVSRHGNGKAVPKQLGIWVGLGLGVATLIGLAAYLLLR